MQDQFGQWQQGGQDQGSGQGGQSGPGRPPARMPARRPGISRQRDLLPGNSTEQAKAGRGAGCPGRTEQGIGPARSGRGRARAANEANPAITARWAAGPGDPVHARGMRALGDMMAQNQQQGHRSRGQQNGQEGGRADPTGMAGQRGWVSHGRSSPRPTRWAGRLAADGGHRRRRSPLAERRPVAQGPRSSWMRSRRRERLSATARGTNAPSWPVVGKLRLPAPDAVVQPQPATVDVAPPFGQHGPSCVRRGQPGRAIRPSDSPPKIAPIAGKSVTPERHGPAAAAAAGGAPGRPSGARASAGGPRGGLNPGIHAGRGEPLPSVGARHSASVAAGRRGDGLRRVRVAASSASGGWGPGLLFSRAHPAGAQGFRADRARFGSRRAGSGCRSPPGRPLRRVGHRASRSVVAASPGQRGRWGSPSACSRARCRRGGR